MTQEKLLVTAPEAARLLAIGTSTLWAKVKIGKLPAPIKIGGSTRWRLSDIQKFANAGRQD